MKFPDRWLPYSNLGAVIAGTRIVCFKTPLRDEYFCGSSANNRWGLTELLKSVPKLGIVIDLTFSTKYYDASELLRSNIQHEKILCKGHSIPSPDVVKRFTGILDRFLEVNRNNDKLIGVHCTHGLNRTGYLVCRYMMDRLNFLAKDAMTAFELARGHKMERQNYLDHLKGRIQHHNTSSDSKFESFQSNFSDSNQPNSKDDRYDSRYHYSYPSRKRNKDIYPTRNTRSPCVYSRNQFPSSGSESRHSSSINFSQSTNERNPSNEQFRSPISNLYDSYENPSYSSRNHTYHDRNSHVDTRRFQNRYVSSRNRTPSSDNRKVSRTERSLSDSLVKDSGRFNNRQENSVNRDDRIAQKPAKQPVTDFNPF